jgi:transposase
MSLMTALSRWAGLTHFIDDGRIELDNNTVERSIRLFSGSDGGTEHSVTSIRSHI